MQPEHRCNRQDDRNRRERHQVGATDAEERVAITRVTPSTPTRPITTPRLGARPAAAPSRECFAARRKRHTYTHTVSTLRHEIDIAP